MYILVRVIALPISLRAACLARMRTAALILNEVCDV